MAGVPGYDPSRLFSQLLNTGLANKDQPLYQTLYLMIQQLVKLTAVTGGSGGGGSSSTVINQTLIQQLGLGSDSGDDSGWNIMVPPGGSGSTGTDAFVPYFIATGETFTVPIYKQALFAMNIDNEGILVVDGFLIEVDGADDPDCCPPPMFMGDENTYEDIYLIGNQSSSSTPASSTPAPPPPMFLWPEGAEDTVYSIINNPYSTEVSVSSTGNIDDLDFGNAALIRMTNASLATIRGLKAGRAGQVVAIVYTSAQVNAAHQNAGSVAQNRLINLVTSGDTPISTAGCFGYQYDGTTERWRLIFHNQGSWLQPAFSAGDYTASGSMTWTVAAGDVSFNGYWVQGKTLFRSFTIVSTTVGGTPSNELRIANPNGYTSTARLFNAGVMNDNGTASMGYLDTKAAANTYVGFFLVTGGNWAAATDNTATLSSIQFEIT